MSKMPFPSSPGLLYRNEVKCLAFDVEMVFHAHAIKSHFHKEGCTKWVFLELGSGLLMCELLYQYLFDKNLGTL